MKEIKFRGKSVIGNHWEYGFYTFEGGHHIIRVANNEWHKEGSPIIVHPESVGQYTGLKDKKGKEIYEGDITRSVVANRDHTGAIIDYDDEITVFRDIRTAADQFIYLVEPVIVANIYESKGVINL